MDREIARILDADYLGDLSTASMSELRSRRAECQTVETALSYLRRLTQGRLDIVAGELDRRRQGGEPGDLTGLIERLPQILADQTRPPSAGHMVEVMDPGQVGGELVEELARLDVGANLTRIHEVDDKTLAETRASLTDLEARISGFRRDLFGRIDEIQAELARRYESGEASVDVLFSHD